MAPDRLGNHDQDNKRGDEDTVSAACLKCGRRFELVAQESHEYCRPCCYYIAFRERYPLIILDRKAVRIERSAIPALTPGWTRVR